MNSDGLAWILEQVLYIFVFIGSPLGELLLKNLDLKKIGRKKLVKYIPI